MKFRKNNSRGVALVLTLIMLAIITVVTVVFLATARRNRQVTTLTHDRTDAEFAGDTAYQRANAEIIERILRDTNMSSFGFLVSQPAGNIAPVRYTNTLPSHPLIPTVTNASRTLGVYLDLNRNGFFDPGLLATNGLGETNVPTGYRLGDPIWIGILDKPWRPHAPNNRFIARMAYAVLPAGDMLDLNNIHNTNYIPGSTASTGYLRNQGFGPWEMNLAAFFAELAPNVWWNDGTPQYSYGPFPKPIADGLAFEDAFSFINYRRGFGQQANSLLMEFPSALLAPSFPPTSIDAYSDGNAGVLLGVDPFLADDVTPPSRAPWSGADSANHFFDIQEVFDQKIFNPLNQPFPHFPERISYVISNDATAYYRLISQLGTDTGSDFRDRINLNYADEHAGYSVTNFQSWDDPAKPELAVAFFTNVAQRIFLAQSNEFNPTTNQAVIRSITEIPISPVNMYSPAIHRILQEAANIFDATRTNIYPSVFRPVFGTKPGNPTNYIIGYVNDSRVSTLQAWLDTNTNGIPMIIGAKKGFPNFNEFTARSDLLMERKVQLTRPDPGSRPNRTNQMYLLGISNYFGAESWNSYLKSPPYPRDVQIVVSNYATATLTNSLGFQGRAVLAVATNNVIPASSWRGGAFGQIDPTSFKMTLNTSTSSWSNAVYRFNGNYFTNIGLNAFEQTTGFPLPYWVCTLSNRVVYYMTEPGSDRIIDFVLLQDYGVIDLFRDLVGARPYDQIPGGVDATIKGVWDTNTASANAPTRGILRQLDISLGTFNTSAADWRQFALTATRNDNDKNSAINAFRSFCGLAPLPGTTGSGATNVSLEMQAPFNPAAKLAVLSTWQANDPLVHYHVDDLRMPGSATNHQYLRPDQPGSNAAPSSLGYMNTRYSPWGGKPNSGYEDPLGYNRAIKDAGVTSSDEWNFPTNKMASIGLLGRIHRGTPWQTIYFKSERAPLFTWTNSSPDLATRIDGRLFSRTHPTNDWRLADMFTTALDERTSSGLLSVNQQGLESWSALLSGVVVLSNSLKTPILNLPREYTEAFIEPWGARPLGQSPLGIIWSNIHAFQVSSPVPLQSVGDILQVPQLTVESPFLNQTGDQIKWGLDDFAYEQIPQQILSLLRVGPARFVIYAYGQALKPAEIDPATGLVSNYQVTAEYATRTVIRVEGDPRNRVRTVIESFNILPPE